MSETNDPPLYTYRARCTRVIDADTCVCDVDLGFGTWVHDVHIRLLGIDGPEVYGDEREAGLLAREWLVPLLEGREVRVQTVRDERDGFGRMLGTLYALGMNINQELVQHGYAKEWTP